MGRHFYRLTHHEFAGSHFLRWIQTIFFVIGGAAAVGWLPGGWLTTGLALILMISSIAAYRYWKAKDFVEFVPTEMPLVIPATLPSSAKIPIWASGYFNVENKYGHFSWLQGFFRTFPSREHAVICLNKPTSLLLVGRSPDSQNGMWYCFFKPETMLDIHWGTIRFGNEELPGLLVTHTVHMPRRSWWQPEKDMPERTYLACPDREDALIILADLLYDRHTVELSSKRSLNGVAKKHPQDSWRALHE